MLVHDRIHLTHYFEQRTTLQIVNNFGQLLYTDQLQASSGNSTVLDWSPVTPGLYWILLRSKDGAQTALKLVVQ